MGTWQRAFAHARALSRGTGSPDWVTVVRAPREHAPASASPCRRRRRRAPPRNPACLNLLPTRARNHAQPRTRARRRHPTQPHTHNTQHNKQHTTTHTHARARTGRQAEERTRHRTVHTVPGQAPRRDQSAPSLKTQQRGQSKHPEAFSRQVKNPIRGLPRPPRGPLVEATRKAPSHPWRAGGAGPGPGSGCARAPGRPRSRGRPPSPHLAERQQSHRLGGQQGRRQGRRPGHQPGRRRREGPRGPAEAAPQEPPGQGARPAHHRHRRLHPTEPSSRGPSQGAAPASPECLRPSPFAGAARN